MLVLLGSHAASLRGIKLGRFPNDLDLAGPYTEVMEHIKSMGDVQYTYPTDKGNKQLAKIDGRMVEAEIAWPGTTTELLIKEVQNDRDTEVMYFEGTSFFVPSIHFLLGLKLTHRYLKNSPHFLKTMADIQIFRQEGAMLLEKHKNFFEIREKATYTYSHPKLNKSKYSFFTPDVPYVYDHDTIHEAMKHLDKPAYSFFKPEHSEVWCDKKMFFDASEEVRLYAVLEETYVLALERSQIPFDYSPLPMYSFMKALEKVCTSITSGWFREYAWENYYKVTKLYDNNYVARFKEALDKGIVKPHEG